MGMTIEDCLHKLDFSIGAYQKLIDENVDNGKIVGTGVRGTWTASTPLNKAYSDMIEALQIAKETMCKYQKIKNIICKWEDGIYDDEGLCHTEVLEKISDEVNGDGKID